MPIVVGSSSRFQPTHVDAVRAVVSVPPPSVSAATKDGTFRCTATFPEPVVDPGSPTHVRFTVTNLTSKPQEAYPEGSFLVRDTSGKKLWNTDFNFEGPGPPRPATKFQPHEERRVFGFDARIRWGGPLLITPVCHGLHLRLPTLRLGVSVPGATPSRPDALQGSLDGSNGLFDGCHPTPDGAAVKGEIPPLSGGHAVPPFPIRCWARISVQPGFDVVDVYFVGPANAPKVQIPPRLQFGSVFRLLPTRKPEEAARTEFIVTPNEVIRNGSDGIFKTAVTKRTMAEFEFYGGHWDKQRVECNVAGEWGGVHGYFDVPFITMCGKGKAFLSPARYRSDAALRMVPGGWCVVPERSAACAPPR